MKTINFLPTFALVIIFSFPVALQAQQLVITDTSYVVEAVVSAETAEELQYVQRPVIIQELTALPSGQFKIALGCSGAKELVKYLPILKRKDEPKIFLVETRHYGDDSTRVHTRPISELELWLQGR